jgi:hypothetical protein
MRYLLSPNIYEVWKRNDSYSNVVVSRPDSFGGDVVVRGLIYGASRRGNPSLTAPSLKRSQDLFHRKSGPWNDVT